MEGLGSIGTELLLRLFTNPVVLKEILDYTKSLDVPMLKWLCFALPSKFLFAVSEPLSLHLRHGWPFGETLNTGWQPLFITGGFVCQRIYKTQWEGDIDICVSNKLVKERMAYSHDDGQILDIIPSYHEHIERMIEHFDLSIVQQGFLGEIYYRTPLSIYTEAHHDIIAMPTDVSVQYMTFHMTPLGTRESHFKTVDIGSYITTHNNKCDAKIMFHECDTCISVNAIDEAAAGGYPMHKWIERARKYTRRFPSFTFSYCRPSI
jgi:hypothetical protein